VIELDCKGLLYLTSFGIFNSLAQFRLRSKHNTKTYMPYRE